MGNNNNNMTCLQKRQELKKIINYEPLSKQISFSLVYFFYQPLYSTTNLNNPKKRNKFTFYFYTLSKKILHF